MIVVLAGCTTFDFAVFSPTAVDAYALDFAEVPPELVEEVEFPSTDGTTLYGAWAHQDPPAPPLVFFHGNAGNLDTYVDRVDYYWSWGTHDVFFFDYRCFGRSEGECDLDVLEEDGRAAVEHVSASTGVPPEDIPWLSLSLGSSVAVHTNDEVRAQVVVLESMFASADDVLDDSVGLDLPEGWFFAEAYDNVGPIRDLQDPVLLIHGREDDFIPPDHVETLFAAAPDPKELWRPAGVGHADVIEVLPAEYRERLEAWMARAP